MREHKDRVEESNKNNRQDKNITTIDRSHKLLILDLSNMRNAQRSESLLTI